MNVRLKTGIILILAFQLAYLPFSKAVAQDTFYRILDIIDLPPELQINQDSSCQIESHEQWILNPSEPSITKKVKHYEVSCVINEDIKLREVSYEFSFLDAHQEIAVKQSIRESGSMERQVRDLLNQFISLINATHPIHEIYNPQEQLLSVYFHEEWILNTKNQVFIKKVKGITPVMWQLRQTVGGEPVHDAETGLPVYYKTKLKRIDLRVP